MSRRRERVTKARVNAGKLRRDAELALLDRVRAEAAMPEMYPHEL